MKKRIIVVGSLIAVALIVLVSFNSVVSIQTSKSDSRAVVSPLFSIRTRRAIKEESKDALTSNYVGKDKGVMIPFPTRDSRTVLLQKIIDSISTMDDASFNRLMGLAISRLRNNNQLKEEDILKIREAFQYIRDNPEEAKTLVAGVKDYEDIPKKGISADIGDPLICFLIGVLAVGAVAVIASAVALVIAYSMISTVGSGWKPGCAIIISYLILLVLVSIPILMILIVVGLTYTPVPCDM